MVDHVPVLLSIAGSDSGGGAGIQADLAAFRDHGFVGATAITAITAQNTRGVERVDLVPVEGLRAQLEAVCSDLWVGAVKIGMLGTAAHAATVADFLESLPERPPVVLDPVMVSTSGHRLLDEDAIAVVRDRLWPLATLTTPNLPEAALLSGTDPVDLGLWRSGRAVLVTGGDAEGAEVEDVLLVGGARRVWTAPRLSGGPFHGTGCTLSSAIAARLAHGDGLEDAVAAGIHYVRRRLTAAVRLGGGALVGGLLAKPALDDQLGS